MPRGRRTNLAKQIRSLRRSARLMDHALAKLAVAVRRVEREAARKTAPPKQRPPRKLRLSPKRRAQLKLQGAYMGFMRPLTPAQKARVKAVKEKRGFEAAVIAARRMARPR